MMFLTNNFISESDTVLHMVRNSGKDYNDYGRYTDCLSIHDEFNYYIATVLYKFPIPLTLGLCLPKVCTISDLNEFKPFLLQAINAALPNLLEDVKGLGEKDFIIGDEELLFVESEVENNKVTDFDGVSLFAALLMTFFLLMSVTSTVIIFVR